MWRYICKEILTRHRFRRLSWLLLRVCRRLTVQVWVCVLSGFVRTKTMPTSSPLVKKVWLFCYLWQTKTGYIAVVGDLYLSIPPWLNSGSTLSLSNEPPYLHSTGVIAHCFCVPLFVKACRKGDALVGFRAGFAALLCCQDSQHWGLSDSFRLPLKGFSAK